MSTEILSESFMNKLVSLLVKSAVTKKKPKALVDAINKDRDLKKAFSDLESATEDIKQWAQRRRKESPEFARFEDELDKYY